MLIYDIKRKRKYILKKCVYLYERMIVTNIGREEMYDCIRDILIEKKREEEKKNGRYLHPTKT
jgi:hypothetical protein